MGRIADLILEAGRARAAGYLGSGQAWGQGLVRLGDLLGQQVQQYAQMRRDEPVRQAQLEAANQQNTIGRMQIASAQTAAQDQAILRSAQGSGLDPDTIKAQLQQLGRGDLIPIYEKTHAELETARLGLQKAKDEGAAREADYFGALAAGVKRANYDPIAVTWALDQADADGHDTKALRAQIQQRPETVKPIIEQLISRSPKQVELAQKESELATKNAAENRMAKVAEAQAANTAADNARADKQLKVSQDQLALAQKREAREATTSSEVTHLTPAGLDIAALNYRKTGVMPPLGMGDKGTRQQIINRAAALTPDDIARIESTADIAQAKADFAANQQSLTALTKQRDAITAFEHTAVKNLENFLTTAKKVVDTGSPLVNRPLRSFSENVLGSPNMTAFNTARRAVIPEFAKILNNPNLSGQLSDSARHEVEELLKGDATLAQTMAAASILLQDVKNRSGALDDQLKAIRARMSGATAAPSATSFVDVGGGFKVREKAK